MASSHQKGNVHSMVITNSPHFFKIILQDTIRNGKLGIPTKFARKYGNGMSSPTFLRVPTGEVWKVELTKSDGKIWLKDGWKEFSNHYSLDFGHFLVFRYEGNSNFHVVIFDSSTSEIEYPYTSNNNGVYKEFPQQNLEKSEDDDSIQILEDFSPSRKMREKSQLPCVRPHKMMRSTNSAIKTKSDVESEFLPAQQFRHNGYPARKGDKSTSCHRILQLKADKKVKALERASGTFKSENPFFLVVMQPSYVGLSRKCHLALPTTFVRRHLMQEHCHGILYNSNGKTWTVSFNQRVNGKRIYASLQSGWDAFVRDNNIQVGDVCAFELINCIDISFKVVIYQGQNANYHHQSFSLTDDVFRPVKKNAGASHAHQGCLKPLNAVQKAKAIKKASTFRSANPYFVVVLQPSYVHSHKLTVPESFARKYFRNMHKEIMLILSNGKTWPVKYYQHSVEKPSAKLCNGWSRFVLDNNLEVGDVCVFELTKATETLLKVTIYKNQAIEDANLGLSPADKSKEDRVEFQESLVIKTESDWVDDKGEMSSLQNQHSTEEFPVPKVKENTCDASVEILNDISLFQETQQEKSASPCKAIKDNNQRD
ncbi:hypothetical protein DITRI_Ditri16bG0028300 [Diplodiscus trichospermus]